LTREKALSNFFRNKPSFLKDTIARVRPGSHILGCAGFSVPQVLITALNESNRSRSYMVPYHFVTNGAVVEKFDRSAFTRLVINGREPIDTTLIPQQEGFSGLGDGQVSFP
jgi:hypothetical protein